MAGRTSFWACDAAWHRRERQVMLGEEFGPAGLCVLMVLHSWAQEQKHTGEVKGGFRTLAREAFCRDHLEARAIVEFAAEIGALDDLVLEEDGRLFLSRVSGWESEQGRAQATVKKAQQRAKRAEATDGDKPGQTGTDEPQPDSVQKSPPTTTRPLPDQTIGLSSGGGRPSDRLDLIDLSIASKRFASAWPMEGGDVKVLLDAEPDAIAEQVVDRLLDEYPRWKGNGVRYWIKSEWLPAAHKKAERRDRGTGPMPTGLMSTTDPAMAAKYGGGA